jgi:hypothetical protein
MKTFFMRRRDRDLSATRMGWPLLLSNCESSVLVDEAEYDDARRHGRLVAKFMTEIYVREIARK